MRTSSAVRRLPVPRRALRADRRVPGRGPGRVAGEPFDFEGEYYRVEGATVFGPPDPVPASTSAGHPPRRRWPPARRRLPDLGRAPGQVAEKITWSGSRPRPGPDAALRHPAARDRPGHRGGGLGRGGPAARTWTRRDRQPSRPSGPATRSARTGCGPCTPYRDGGSAQDLDLPEPVGRRRAGPRRGGHRPGRQPRAGRRPHRGVRPLGIDEFILSGWPHLEEAYWFGEGVLPEIRGREAAGGNCGRPPPAEPAPSSPAAPEGNKHPKPRP